MWGVEEIINPNFTKTKKYKEMLSQRKEIKLFQRVKKEKKN